MDKALIERATKQVRSAKPKENFMLIRFDYSRSIVLPYKEGLRFMESLEKAEAFHPAYGDTKGITPVPMDWFETKLMSAEEYELNKMAALLNIAVDDLRAYMNKGPECLT